jgi:hypothetical protein
MPRVFGSTLTQVPRWNGSMHSAEALVAVARDATVIAAATARLRVNF